MAKERACVLIGVFDRHVKPEEHWRAVKEVSFFNLVLSNKMCDTI